PCSALHAEPCQPAVCGFQVNVSLEAGAPEGERNGNYRHGARTKGSIGLKDFIGSARQRAVRFIPSRFLASDPFGISRRPLLALCDGQPFLCRTVAVSSQLSYGGRATILAMRALAFALVLSLSLLGVERARAAELPLPGGAPIPPPSSYYPVSPPINWGGV